MKTSIAMNCLRLAVLAAATLTPGMAACSYSAYTSAPTLGAGGGYVAVTVYTQPGCRWSVNQADVWATPLQRNATGTGTIYIYVAPTRSARSAAERVYSDYLSSEVGLGDGSIGGRSSVTGQLMRPILQFRITEN
jgi:hypothetical protein